MGVSFVRGLKCSTGGPLNLDIRGEVVHVFDFHLLLLLALLLLSDGRRGPQLHVLSLIAADHALILVSIDHHTVLTMDAIGEVRIAALRYPTIKAMRHVLLSIVSAFHVEAST